MGKFLQLMRTGTYTDRHGVSHNITKDVLNKIAETFDPARPPQLTVGHPDRSTFPTFGVIDALKVVGDKLLFKPARVCAEFAALVRRGGFPGVSAGLSKDLSRLDHVAFLSAQNPAIPGLEPIAEFCASPEEEVAAIDVTAVAEGLAEFAAPDWWITSRMREIASLLRGMKNYVIEKDGAEVADKLLPEYTFDTLAQDPPPSEPVEESAGFSATPEFDVGQAAASVAEPDYRALYNELLPKHEAAEKSVAEFSSAIDALTSEKNALALRVAQLEKAERLAEFGAWVEEQIAAGRVVPDQKKATVEVMESLDRLSRGAEFSAVLEQTCAPTPLECYKKNIEAGPRVAPQAGVTPAPEFAASAVCREQAGMSSVSKMAQDYMDEQEAKGVKVSATDAVHHVMRNYSL